MAHEDGTSNVTEIVRFYDLSMNEEEAAAFAVTKQLDGCVRSYHGFMVSTATSISSEQGIWVQAKALDWLSLSHHSAFQRSAIYPSFTARVTNFASTEHIDILHVQLKPYPAVSAFTAPFTQVTIATLRPTTSAEAFAAAMNETPNALDNVSYGAILEDERQYLIVNGLQTLEAHQKAAATLSKIHEIAEVDTRHYALTS